MCGDPNDSYTMTQLRCKVIIQLVLEIFYLIMAMSTVEDGGYMGIGACAFGLFGTIVVVARLVPPPAAFAKLCICNHIATPLSIAHVALALWRAATVDDWCCKQEDTDKAAVAALLYGLSFFFSAVAATRLAIVHGSNGASRARYETYASRTSVVPVGEPVVAVPVAAAVGEPVVGVQVTRQQ